MVAVDRLFGAVVAIQLAGRTVVLPRARFSHAATGSGERPLERLHGEIVELDVVIAADQPCRSARVEIVHDAAHGVSVDHRDHVNAAEPELQVVP